MRACVRAATGASTASGARGSPRACATAAATAAAAAAAASCGRARASRGGASLETGAPGAAFAAQTRRFVRLERRRMRDATAKGWRRGAVGRRVLGGSGGGRRER
jgi:hypothetical protein